MLFVYSIQWIFLISYQISAQNITFDESINKRSDKVRRQWPEIKFEDLDFMSGDGPLTEHFKNITETYVWTTIITQIKATVLPTITRTRVLTPKPNELRVSSTPIMSCRKYWSQITYDLPIEANSEDSILRRSSMIYPGPSSTMALSSRLHSSDISMSSYRSPLISISESLQSYFATKSVIPFDRLTQHFSTKDYISSLKINANSYSTPYIESSLTFPMIESMSTIESTPIHWSSVSIENDKNSISGSIQSLSISREEDIVSSDKSFITSIESSFRLISVSTTQTIDDRNKTVDRLKSSPVAYTTSLANTTPIPVPLCPESVQTITPRESLKKPFEDYLIRTVLNNTSNESILNRTRIEQNLRDIYIYAFKKRYNITDQMTGYTRKLLSKVNYTDIEVKIRDVIISEGSNQIDVIYYVEKDGALIPYEDAFSTLSYISDEEYTEMIGLTVIEKVKPYNEIKLPESGLKWIPSALQGDHNLWSIILIWILGAIIIICIIAVLLVFCKYRSERRKWIDAFHSELNRVVPDNQIHWRTVSKPLDPSSTTNTTTNDTPKVYDNRNEFQYLGFESKVKPKDVKTKSLSKATQIESSLQMEKQKVIPIGDLIDESTDSSERSAANEYIRTFVTTKEIETKTDSIPRLMSVQMSAQTESIIRAIRSELNRFGHNSNAIPFIDDTQPEESIISNSSEA